MSRHELPPRHLHGQPSKKIMVHRSSKPQKKLCSHRKSKPGNSRQCVIQRDIHSWPIYKKRQENGPQQTQDRAWRSREGVTGCPGGACRRLLGFWPGSTSYSGGGRGGDHVDVCFGVSLTSRHAYSAFSRMWGRQEGRQS